MIFNLRNKNYLLVTIFSDFCKLRNVKENCGLSPNLILFVLLKRYSPWIVLILFFFFYFLQPYIFDFIAGTLTLCAERKVNLISVNIYVIYLSYVFCLYSYFYLLIYFFFLLFVLQLLELELMCCLFLSFCWRTFKSKQNQKKKLSNKLYFFLNFIRTYGAEDRFNVEFNLCFVGRMLEFLLKQRKRKQYLCHMKIPFMEK